MLYIHIPFCACRCAYCDFYSTTQLQWRERYVDALCQELKSRVEECSLSRVPSLYIGGGTPSQLTTPQIGRIVETAKEHYPLAEDAELTIELNPDDVTPRLVRDLKQIGFNRISIGIQTFHDDLLQIIRRRHNASQAREAIQYVRQGGFSNISLDLMYGLPGQTMQAWHEDVREALALGVPHISAYSLQWEEGTALWKMLQNGQVQEADEELSEQMYIYLMDSLAEAGYEHYEISNFATPGFHSRHNSGYWRGIPYLGFGAGAHSYDGKNHRRLNTPSLQEYLQQEGCPPHEVEELSKEELLEEMIMTRLRTKAGLDLTQISRHFGDDAVRRILKASKPHLQQGRMAVSGDMLLITRKGIFVSNDIISDLF